MFLLSFFLSMTLVLFLVSKKINIGLSLFIGGTILMLFNQLSIGDCLSIYANTFTSPQTVSLALTIAFISVLGHMMDVYGIMDKMIDALETMLRSAKATVLIAPSVIGTLLVTGGALMSCPVVGSLGERLNMSNEKRASANLVFRHALYFIFPFAPTLILASELGELNLWDFILIQMPIALAMYVLGYFLYLRKLNADHLIPEKTDGKRLLKSIGAFTYYASPIWISFVGALVFHMSFYSALLIGIIITRLLAIQLIPTLSEKAQSEAVKSIFTHIKNGFRFNMVFAIIGIMFFKNVINHFDDLHIFLNKLLNMGIPLEVMIILAAAIICFPLASTQPGIAILFPIILPMAPDYHTRLLYAMFIYTSSFVFYYISPLHMCQVLTLEYFNVNLKSLYKNYIVLLPITYLVMVAVYFIML